MRGVYWMMKLMERKLPGGVGVCLWRTLRLSEMRMRTEGKKREAIGGQLRNARASGKDESRCGRRLDLAESMSRASEVQYRIAELRTEDTVKWRM